MLKSRFSNLIILIVGLFLIVNLSRSIWQLYKAGDQIKEAEDNATQMQAENNELKKKFSTVQSPAYLEKIAREKLGLAKEGEMVVILPPVEPEATKSGNQTNLQNWQKWWKLFF